MLSYISSSMPTSIFGQKDVSYADYLKKTSSYQQPEMEFEEEPQAHTEHERISVSVVTHHGRFRRAIPVMPMGLAALCCFCNIFVPGLGTLLSSFAALCCSDPRGGTRGSAFGANLLAAFLQFVTFPLIVGVVWSVIWGVLFVQLALEKHNAEQTERRKAKERIAFLAARTEEAQKENCV